MESNGNYVIHLDEFVRGVEPMISIVRQDENYFAVDDHEKTICSDQNVNDFSKKLFDIIICSLSKAWPGNKVRILFHSQKEQVDFLIVNEGKGKFSLLLKSQEPKEGDIEKFWEFFKNAMQG
jgi:hypothetical protein